jgi:hypothetical protein
VAASITLLCLPESSATENADTHLPGVASIRGDAQHYQEAGVSVLDI